MTTRPGTLDAFYLNVLHLTVTLRFCLDRPVRDNETRHLRLLVLPQRIASSFLFFFFSAFLHRMKRMRLTFTNTVFLGTSLHRRGSVLHLMVTLRFFLDRPLRVLPERVASGGHALRFFLDRPLRDNETRHLRLLPQRIASSFLSFFSSFLRSSIGVVAYCI